MTRILGICLLVVAVGIPMWTWGEETPDMDRLARDKFAGSSSPDPSSRDWFRALEAARFAPLEKLDRVDNCPHDFDVLHYNITLEIDFDNDLIYGDTRVLSVSELDSLTQIDLNLKTLTVDAVLQDTDSLSYVHAGALLTIDLGASYSIGDSLEVRVIYQGHPGNEGPGGFGGFWFEGTPEVAYQMGVGLNANPPSMGKYWFPCWDQPCDKATAEYHITVPINKKAVCNGVLTGTSVDSVAGTATFDWSMTHQIAPHVMMVAARRYTEIVDSTYSWIHYWVIPMDEADARIHYQNVDAMMDGFVERYGPYPFSAFGYVAAIKGDMEHQTCVTHQDGCIVPNHSFDWLLAHELAHMWWGDCVAVNDWRDIWLSEGFATYSEAIFREFMYGTESFRYYMQTRLMQPVFNSAENFPIYDPDYLWGSTVYEKGGTVLHMLRHVVGDSVYYGALAAYRQAHEYGNAVTPQFQQAVESVYGQSLDWFFLEWIYDVGWPEYEYAWTATPQRSGYVLDLIINQVHTNGPVYTMPVDVGISTAAGDTVVIVWVDEVEESFQIEVSSEPTAVELDPDNWILNKATEVPYTAVDLDVALARDLRLEQNVPNPFNPSTSICYSVPRSGDLRLEIFNALGQRVAVLVDGPVGAGTGEVVWNGTDEQGRAVASGTYFCRMTTDDGSQMRRAVLLR